MEKGQGYSPDADVELLRRAYVFSALRTGDRSATRRTLSFTLDCRGFSRRHASCDVVAIARGRLQDVVEDRSPSIRAHPGALRSEVAHVVEGSRKIARPVFLE